MCLNKKELILYLFSWKIAYLIFFKDKNLEMCMDKTCIFIEIYTKLVFTLIPGRSNGTVALNALHQPFDTFIHTIPVCIVFLETN